MKITKRQLKRIIKEEKDKILSEQERAWEYSDDDELRQLGMTIEDMLQYSTEMYALMDEMGMRYGELAALGTHARTIKQTVHELADKYDRALDDIERFSR